MKEQTLGIVMNGVTERMRCWLVPMRPVTTLITMPRVCSFMGQDGRAAPRRWSRRSHMGEIGLLDVVEEPRLVAGPEAAREDLNLDESPEARIIGPPADPADRDAALPHEA